MEDFLRFRRMITPMIIEIIFWVGIALCALVFLVSIISGHILGALISLLIGPLTVRIYCELLILAFRIYYTLEEIKNNTLPKTQ